MKSDVKLPALYGQSIDLTFRDSGDVALAIECPGADRRDGVVLSSAQAMRLARKLADRAASRRKQRRAASER